MYVIDESKQKINDEIVGTFLRKVTDGDTVLEVEAGTTGFKGGDDRDTGSRTYLALLCRRGDFFLVPIKDEGGRTVGIRIANCGDDGLTTILKALEFAHRAIMEQCCKADD